MHCDISHSLGLPANKYSTKIVATACATAGLVATLSLPCVSLLLAAVSVGALRSRVISEALQADMREMTRSALLAPRLAIVAVADGLVIGGSAFLALAVSLDLALVLPLARLSRISRGATASVATASVATLSV